MAWQKCASPRTRRKRLGAAVLGLVATAILLLAGSHGALAFDMGKFVSDLNVALTAATKGAEVRRALVINEKSLATLQDVNLAASLRREDLATLVPDLIERANAGKDFKKQRVVLSEGKLVPTGNELSLTVKVTKTFDDAVVELKADGSIAVAASQDMALFAFFINRLEVTHVKVTKAGVDLGLLSDLLTKGVTTLLPVVNAGLDLAANKTGQLGTRIAVPALFSKNLKKLDTGTLQFDDDRQIDVFATVARSAVLVTSNGVAILAAAVNQKPNPKKGVLPQFDAPGAISPEEVANRQAAYRAAFLEKYAAAFGKDAPPVLGKTFVVVTRGFVAQTINDALKAPPFCAKGEVVGPQPPFSAPISLPGPKKRQCDDIVNSCKFKDACKSTEACAKTIGVKEKCQIGKKLDKVLKGLSWVVNATPIFGICSVSKVIDIDTPACTAFRATKKVNPLICNAASNLDKAQCDTVVAADKAFCQGEEKLRKFVTANPVAMVHGQVTPDVEFKACMAGAQIDPDLQKFTAALSGSAKGPLKVHIKFENKTPSGVGLCTADWSDDFSVKAEAGIPKTPLTFDISTQAKPDGLDLTFDAGNHDVKVDFKPAPLDELFLRHPKMLVNCTPLAGLAAAFAAYDTSVKNQAKSWSPLLSGKDYKLTVKHVKFNLHIPAMDIKSIDKKVLVSLKPRWLSKAIAFVK